MKPIIPNGQLSLSAFFNDREQLWSSQNSGFCFSQVQSTPQSKNGFRGNVPNEPHAASTMLSAFRVGLEWISYECVSDSPN